MSEADVDWFIETELEPARVVNKLGNLDTNEMRIHVPDTCHCTWGFEGKSEFAALHPRIQQHLKSIRSGNLTFEVLNYRNLVETQIMFNGQSITKFKDEPSSVIIACFGRHPYRYVPNIPVGAMSGLVAAMIAAPLMIFWFNMPQPLFLGLLVLVFGGVAWGAARLTRYRLKQIQYARGGRS